jgi:hypothetical protein
MKKVWSKVIESLCWTGPILIALSLPAADGDPITQEQFQQLKQQNLLLQQRLEQQQKLIGDLSDKVAALQKSPVKASEDEPAATTPTNSTKGLSLGKVHLSGEGGVAFFRSEANGPYPNSEFRVDEAKLFVEAPIFKDVYLFSELNLVSREDPSSFFQLGELYLDFENVSRLWNRERQLNVRVGRFDIPFGEEYLSRDAIDNPLISHSLSDIWGVDEGIEIYGCFGKIQYALAVQNGGHPSLRDYDADKSIALRLGYDPTKRLHLSASAMRTGSVATMGDQFSELWFGNAFAGGFNATATRFQANLVEADAQFRWSQGYAKTAAGYLKYDDNGPGNFQRDVYYYYFEGVQHLASRLYAAGRWSQILASGGYPLVGDGPWGQYYFGGLTRNLWRLTLGAGYRFSPNLVFKADYTLNGGNQSSGGHRTHENVLAAEAAFSF